VEDGLFQAGSGKSSHVEFNDNHTELTVKGVLFDQLWLIALDTGNGIYDSRQGQHSLRDTNAPSVSKARLCYDVLESCANELGRTPYQTPGGFKDAFWRTLIANVTDFPREANSDFEQNFDTYLDFQDAKMRYRYGGGFQLDDDVHTWARHFAAAENLVSFSRCIGLTKKGYVASIPPHTLLGDYVCVLYGGRVPKPTTGRSSLCSEILTCTG
jgi:hypothetical protein